MIDQITQAAVAPFLDPVGWQAFAYGLLGLKAVKRMIRNVRGFIGGNSDGK